MRLQNNDWRGARNPRYSHGGRVGEGRSPTYVSWTEMRFRCLSRKSSAWENYGGRGIKICDRWSRFENFLADMGERPPGTTLDRIDNSGNYEPGNCRWATPLEQGRNRRGVKLTIDQADEIRRLYAAGWHPTHLAERFSVVRGTVDHIIAGRNWVGDVVVERREFRNAGNRKLSDGDVRNIRSSPASSEQIALHLGVSQSTVERVRARKTYSWIA